MGQIGEAVRRAAAKLEAAGGTLPYGDKSGPEEIKAVFGMSKAAFKRAIGRLLKNKKIEIVDGKIRKLLDYNREKN